LHSALQFKNMLIIFDGEINKHYFLALFSCLIMLMCNFTLTITDEMLYGGTKMQNQSFSKDEVEKWVATSTYKSIA